MEINTFAIHQQRFKGGYPLKRVTFGYSRRVRFVIQERQIRRQVLCL